MKDLASYVDGWRERARNKESELRQRREMARTTVPSLARLLAEEFGAKRVLLVGSLRRGTFGDRSDIDLATEGLDSMAAATAALELSDRTRLAVDVIPLECVRESWRAHLEQWGEQVWPTS